MAAQNPPQQDDGGQAPAAGPEQGGGAPGGDEQQFGKAEGGGNPNHDPKNGRFTSGAGGGVIFSPRYGGVTLYHGTTPEAKAAIDQQGVMRGPVFFSPSKSAATDYASDGESVVEVNVPADALCVDFDLPGARLLTVDDANEYTGNDWTLDDYIDAGYSVGINESLVVDKAAYEAAGGDAMAKASHGGNPNHDPETGRFTSRARAILLGAPVAVVEMGTIQAREGEKASDAALRWLAENPQDDLSREGIGKVVFDRKSVFDTLGHGFSGPKLNALAAVPDVVRHGVELDSDMDWDERPLMNRILAAPIELSGNRYTMFVRLLRDTSNPKLPSRFYVHEAVIEKVVTNEEASPLLKFGSDPESYRGRKSGGTGFYVSLARRALGVNDGSESAGETEITKSEAERFGPIIKAIGMPPVIRIQLPEVE
ncbi:MAG TPA: hypothetical protein PLK50_04105 [Ottowia sp.]|nr:hypothetical protein [Ottowia sp.]HPZ56484.1 hypothetical protein [Ottowia sp.]HQD47618.1 hypothetical protein [Ottowia sp.]